MDTKYIPVLILCLLGAFLLKDKFELYGLSQDEGVYQTTAISYMYSNNDTQKDLDEYRLLDEETREKFREKLDYLIDFGMHGYYLFDAKLSPRDSQVQRSEVSGYYHGVGTFPAQLALWGWIFGLEKMMGIQTLFWILAVLLAYMVMDQFRISRWAKLLITGVYAISPIMLWVGKSSLTELFLACLFNFYLYELLKEKSPNAVLMALPMVTFSFFHLSVYSIMPIICICFFVKFWYRRDREYLLAGMLTTLGYIAGILYVAWSHTEYFYINVQILQKLSFITQDNVIQFMVGCGILGCAIFILLLLFADQLPNKRVLPGKWVIRILTIGLAGIGIYQIIKLVNMEGHWGNFTLLSYDLLTGLVLLPLVVVMVIKFAMNICKSSQHIVLVLLFLYCVILYSVAFRRETLGHYYGDRYILPYLSVIFILIGALAEYGWLTRRYRITVLICTVIAAVYMLPHDIFVIENQDDTRLPWDTLLEIAGKLKPGDVLIIQDEAAISSFFPLRDIAAVYCYPVFEDGVYDTYEKVKNIGENVYLLSSREDDWGMDTNGWRWQISYKEYQEAENPDVWDPLAMEQIEVVHSWNLQKIDG